MYDFCFTPIYASILALGGAIGFIVAGSVESLGKAMGLDNSAKLCLLKTMQVPTFH